MIVPLFRQRVLDEPQRHAPPTTPSLELSSNTELSASPSPSTQHLSRRFPLALPVITISPAFPPTPPLPNSNFKSLHQIQLPLHQLQPLHQNLPALTSFSCPDIPTFLFSNLLTT